MCSQKLGRDFQECITPHSHPDGGIVFIMSEGCQPGDVFSDLDVYGYTETNVLFKVTQDDFDAFYELSFGTDHALILMYRTSLSIDAMNDYEVIVCH